MSQLHEIGEEFGTKTRELVLMFGLKNPEVVDSHRVLTLVGQMDQLRGRLSELVREAGKISNAEWRDYYQDK